MLFRFVKLHCNLVFSLFVFSCLIFSCVSQEKISSDFYQGLLADEDAARTKLFEKSLASENEYIRQASSDELAVLMSRGIKLSTKIMDRVMEEASPWWKDAFEATEPDVNEKKPSREKALFYLLDFEQGATSNEARSYVLNELAKYKDFFCEHETAAIEAHYAVSHLRYNNALEYFRAFQDTIYDSDDSFKKEWPSQIPQLFIEYPNLINDLGRAFQFTSSGKEGLDLFIKWEAGLPENQYDDLRFRLNFYAGRIARRVGSSQTNQAIAYFERALALAPDSEQEDSCIWYILDLSLTGPIPATFDRFIKYIPQWHSAGTYNNLLERFLHRLVSGREWNRVIRIFNLLKDTGNVAAKPGYAYVIARAIEENYLSAEDKRLAARSLDLSAADAKAFMQYSYDNSNLFIMPAIFYRMKSSDALGLPFLNFNEEDKPCGCNDKEVIPSHLIQFLIGFFNNGAAHLANPYIKTCEKKMCPAELRTLAHTLDEAGLYPQSMGIATLYINREGYERSRRDMELMYPRPYKNLIENQSKEFDIDPPLFFALVRTESAFQSAIVSRAGAVGLSQLMPSTAKDQAERIRRGGGPDFFDSEEKIDSTNPELNVYIGTYYLNYLRGYLNDMYLALMAYNGGQNRVRRWHNANRLPMDLFLETVPIYETRDYGKRVTAIGKVYSELYYFSIADSAASEGDAVSSVSSEESSASSTSN